MKKQILHILLQLPCLLSTCLLSAKTGTCLLSAKTGACLLSAKTGVCLLTVCLLSSCGGDDSYEYPSVKLEFLTAESGSDSSIIAVTPDKGSRLMVSNDLSDTKIEANSTKRIISNYEEVVLAGGGTAAKIYAMAAVIAAAPQPPSAFKDGVKTDPADVLSIWMGRDYLNIILSVKAQTAKHSFHFVETETGVDNVSGRKYAKILLYHDDGGEAQGYTQRAYASIPLAKYASTTEETVDIYFSLNTTAGELKTYTFEY